jgi:hypothetical protein
MRMIPMATSHRERNRWPKIAIAKPAIMSDT